MKRLTTTLSVFFDIPYKTQTEIFNIYSDLCTGNDELFILEPVELDGKILQEVKYKKSNSQDFIIKIFESDQVVSAELIMTDEQSCYSMFLKSEY